MATGPIRRSGLDKKAMCRRPSSTNSNCRSFATASTPSLPSAQESIDQAAGCTFESSIALLLPYSITICRCAALRSFTSRVYWRNAPLTTL